jgi:hypothetical protein
MLSSSEGTQAVKRKGMEKTKNILLNFISSYLNRFDEQIDKKIKPFDDSKIK